VVGIVIVAHSSELAEAIKLLAQQMLRKAVPLVSVGGIDDPVNPFGTDATKIQKAIESVFSEDGVIVLMDLGSALLSAEMSLEFLSDEKRKRVHLCEAPLVEGTIAAAVQSEAGGSLEQVIEEALGSLTSKADQLKKEHFVPLDHGKHDV
jgi:phosphocarrier protein FPr